MPIPVGICTALDSRSIDVRNVTVQTGFDGGRALLAYFRAHQEIDWEAVSSGDGGVVANLYVYIDWGIGQFDDFPARWRDVSRKDTCLADFRVSWNHWLDRQSFWTLERSRLLYDRFVSEYYDGEPLVNEVGDPMVYNEQPERYRPDVTSPPQTGETLGRSRLGRDLVHSRQEHE